MNPQNPQNETWTPVGNAPQSTNTPAQSTQGETWTPVKADSGTQNTSVNNSDNSIAPSFSGIVGTVKELGSGFRKGVDSTAQGLVDLTNKVMGNSNPTPGSFLDPHHEISTTPTTDTEKVGYGGETLLEFLAGDEALKGLSYAAKLEQAAKTAKILETSPKLMKAVQIGARSIRAGVVQGSQHYARTGDAKESAISGLETAGVALPLGLAAEGVSALGGKLTKGAEASKGLAEASDAAVTDKAGTADAIQTHIENAKQELHQNYEDTVQDLLGRADGTNLDPTSDAEVPMRARAEQLLKNPSPPDHELVSDTKSMTGEKLDGGVKKLLRKVSTGYSDPDAFDAWKEQQDQLTKGVLQDVKGKLYKTQDLSKLSKANAGTDASLDIGQLKSVDKLKKPTALQDYDLDSLIKLRQEVRQAAQGYDYGNVNSRTLNDMLFGIDDSIDKLAEKVPDDKLLSEYRDLRQDYKTKINIYNNDNVVKNLRAGKYDDAFKALTSGNQSAKRVQNLRTILGDERTDDFAQKAFGNMLQDNTDANGQVNPAKLVRGWEKIPQETRDAFFHAKPAIGPQTQIQSLMSDAKSARAIQYLTRTGVITPAAIAGGQFTHLGLLGMLLSEGAAGGLSISKVGDVLDYVANHPWTWKAVNTTGKVLQAPVSRAVTGIAAQTVSKGSKALKQDVYNSATGLSR